MLGFIIFSVLTLGVVFLLGLGSSGAVLYIIHLLFMLAIIAAGRIKIVQKQRPIELTSQAFLSMLSREENTDEPFTDEEFELVKKAYGNTEGSSIGIPLIATLCSVIIFFFSMGELADIFKLLYFPLMLFSWFVWRMEHKKAKDVFEIERNLFRKKKAFVWEADEYDLYSARNASNPSTIHKSGKALVMKIAMLDKGGKPVAYKQHVSPEIFYYSKKTGKLNAVMYNGEFTGLVDLKEYNIKKEDDNPSEL